jgi:hypothetical protein
MNRERRLHPWRRLVIGRILLTLGAIVMVAAFTTHLWWVAAGTVSMAAGLGLVLLSLRASTTGGEHGTG